MNVRSLLRSRGRHFAWGAVFLVATNLAANAMPWLMKQAVEATERGDLDALWSRVLLLAAFAAVGAVVRVLSRVFVFNGARYIEYDLRNRLFSHLVVLPPPWYGKQATGDLMSRVTNDVTYLRLLFGPGMLNVVNTICAYAMALPLLLIIDVQLALFTLFPIPVLLALSRTVARSIQVRQRAVSDELSALSARVQESLTGMGVIKAFSLGARERASFGDRNEAYLEKSLRLVTARGLFMPLVGSIAGLGTLILLFAGGWAVATERIGLGDLVAFMGYLTMLTWPTMALGWVISSWQRGLAAIERLREVLDVQPSIADPDDPMPLPRPDGALEVRGLTIGHGDREPTLTDVSLAIPAGGSLGVVGRTGCGKTTLISTLARLLDVPEGTVFLDGVDITRLTLADLRSAVALVPQDAFLFSTSLRDNIAFADPVPGGEDREARVVAAGRLASLDREVEAFPDGWDTVVGERGITLSGGQRQRTAIARALLADRPVLILDDALSSVDAETEQHILAGLRRAATGRTTVVVSHRLSGVAWCDQVLVLADGRVAQSGSHESLLEQGGWYADTWALQQAAESSAPGEAEP